MYGQFFVFKQLLDLIFFTMDSFNYEQHCVCLHCHISLVQYLLAIVYWVNISNYCQVEP